MLFRFDENRQPRSQITLMVLSILVIAFEKMVARSTNVAQAISVDVPSLHKLEASDNDAGYNSCMFRSFAVGTGNASSSQGRHLRNRVTNMPARFAGSFRLRASADQKPNGVTIMPTDIALVLKRKAEAEAQGSKDALTVLIIVCLTASVIRIMILILLPIIFKRRV